MFHTHSVGSGDNKIDTMGDQAASSSSVDKMIMKYDGTSDPTRWIRMVERAAKCMGWTATGSTYSNNAAIFTTGKALQFVEDNELDGKEWSVQG